MPTSAASRPSAPAVAAVMPRRVRALAPVAVSVRMSPEVSLRISPIVIASTPSATRMPTPVASLRTSSSDGVPFLVSIVRPAAAATRRALLI